MRELPVDTPNLTRWSRPGWASSPPTSARPCYTSDAEPCGPDELASVADAQVLAALEDAGLVRAEADGARLRLRSATPSTAR